MVPIDPPDLGRDLARPLEVDACSCGCGAERGQPCADASVIGVHGLLSGPTVIFGAECVERWELGAAATRRAEHLHRALGPGMVTTTPASEPAWVGPGGEELLAVEIHYHSRDAARGAARGAR